MNSTINNAIQLVTALLLLTATPVSAQGQLGASDVRTLFNGNTAHSLHLIRDHEASLYYDPDGRFYGIRDESIFQGKWEVRDDATICLIRENGKTICRGIMKEDGTYYKFKIKGNGDIKKIIEYKSFTPGNPNNYKYVN